MKKKRKDMSLWERAMSLKKIDVDLSSLLEPHELLSPEQRRKNIEKARKKGLIKAKVIF